jgi:hypothetical protein
MFGDFVYVGSGPAFGLKGYFCAWAWLLMHCSGNSRWRMPRGAARLIRLPNPPILCFSVVFVGGPGVCFDSLSAIGKLFGGCHILYNMATETMAAEDAIFIQWSLRSPFLASRLISMSFMPL